MNDLKHLREEVYDANMEMVRRGLVLYTFGNASGILQGDDLVAIKPSGVPYEKLRPEDLVVVRLDGSPVEGTMRPSSDLPTHLVLYRAFAGIGAWCTRIRLSLPHGRRPGARSPAWEPRTPTISMGPCR